MVFDSKFGKLQVISRLPSLTPCTINAPHCACSRCAKILNYQNSTCRRNGAFFICQNSLLSTTFNALIFVTIFYPFNAHHLIYSQKNYYLIFA